MLNRQLSGPESNQQSKGRKVVGDPSPPIVLKILPTASVSRQSHGREPNNFENSNQDHHESVKILDSSDGVTTFEKSREDQRKNERSHPPGDHYTGRGVDHDCQKDGYLERQPKYNDISEEKQLELKEMEQSKDLYMELLNQDSFINGTFHLENTHSLEKFREIEKMCDHQVEGSQELQEKPKLPGADRRTSDDAPWDDTPRQSSREMPP